MSNILSRLFDTEYVDSVGVSSGGCFIDPPIGIRKAIGAACLHGTSDIDETIAMYGLYGYGSNINRYVNQSKNALTSSLTNNYSNTVDYDSYFKSLDSSIVTITNILAANNPEYLSRVQYYLVTNFSFNITNFTFVINSTTYNINSITRSLNNDYSVNITVYYQDTRLVEEEYACTEEVTYYDPVLDEEGNPVLDENGDPVTTTRVEIEPAICTREVEEQFENSMDILLGSSFWSEERYVVYHDDIVTLFPFEVVEVGSSTFYNNKQYPIIPIRTNFTTITKESNSTEYKLVKSLLPSLEDILADIDGSSEIDTIKDAYVHLAIAPENNKYTSKYLFNLFDFISGSAGTSTVTTITWATEVYRCSLNIGGITKEEISHTADNGYLTAITDSYSQYVDDVYEMNPGVLTVIRDLNGTRTTYSATVELVYFVFKKDSINTGLYNATHLTADSRDNFRIPLISNVINDYTYTSIELEQIYYRSVTITYHGYQTTAVRWYEKQWFKNLLIALSFYVTAGSISAAVSGSITTSTAIGATLVSAGMTIAMAVFLEGIIISVIIKETLKLALKYSDNDFTRALATIGAIYSAFAFSNIGALGGISKSLDYAGMAQVDKYTDEIAPLIELKSELTAQLEEYADDEINESLLSPLEMVEAMFKDGSIDDLNLSALDEARMGYKLAYSKSDAMSELRSYKMRYLS